MLLMQMPAWRLKRVPAKPGVPKDPCFKDPRTAWTLGPFLGTAPNPSHDKRTPRSRAARSETRQAPVACQCYRVAWSRAAWAAVRDKAVGDMPLAMRPTGRVATPPAEVRVACVRSPTATVSSWTSFVAAQPLPRATAARQLLHSCGRRRHRHQQAALSFDSGGEMAQSWDVLGLGQVGVHACALSQALHTMFAESGAGRRLPPSLTLSACL